MSGSAVTSPPVAPPHARRLATTPEGSSTREAIREAASRRSLPWSLAGCVALAALTLLTPSAPTYDPWAWIIWGREILHLDLVTTYGPSWKPLPVALTTVFALFGGAAPALWVVAARAGAIAGVLFAFRLGRRLGGPAAGVVAAVALLVAPWYVRSAALANSEGLQVAFALAALDRAFAGSRRASFALAIGLGLLRPEAWPFLGLFGLWLFWRDRGARLLVGAGLASLPLFWLVPEKLGSGDWLRAAHRAQHPVGKSAAFSDNPVLQVLHDGWHMLGGPIRWSLVAAIGVALVQRDKRLGALIGLGAVWTLIVAAMTANGYSGNARYLIVPAAVMIVVAAAGVMHGVRALARRFASRRMPVALAVLGTAALACAFAVPWLDASRRTISATSWQARMSNQLEPLVNRAGGAARLRACGTPITGAYLVPAVAWRLGVHIRAVHLTPERPGVVFRVHTTRSASALPALAPLGDLRGLRTLATSADWRIVAACTTGS